MIATHIPKMFNARLKQTALNAQIIGPVPAGLVHSCSVEMRKKHWAAPLNGADIGTVKAEMVNLPLEQPDVFQPLRIIPDLQDGRAKQLLMPLDNWRGDDYLSVTPVASAGVMHEVFKRLYERQMPHRTWLVQPIPGAYSNHGQALSDQAGRLRLLRRGLIHVDRADWEGDFVEITARVQSANVSAGMVSVGWPAITAIGGMVHALERQTGQDIDFAIGLHSAEWQSGIRKGARLKPGSKDTVLPDYSTDEIMGHLDLVLLLDADDLDKVAAAAQSISRIAGGSVLDMQVRVRKSARAPHAVYLYRIPVDADALDATLDLYAEGGEWRDKGWYQNAGVGATLTMCGYALLEQPQERKLARGNYLHAWTEPVFACVGQSDMQERCWWSRKTTSGYAGFY